MSEKEIVYVLTNSAMPGLVKVGKTTQSDVRDRMLQLYTTGVPVKFECEFATEVDDCTKVEKAIHIAFGPYRINQQREFFKIDPEQAIAVLKEIGDKDVTPIVKKGLKEDITQAEKASIKKLQKRPNMNFIEMNIPVGSKLLYKDDVTEVIIQNEKKVLYNGQIMSLTAATRDLLGLDYSVQPSPYWTFEEKLLKEIYNDTYSNEDD